MVAEMRWLRSPTAIKTYKKLKMEHTAKMRIQYLQKASKKPNDYRISTTITSSYE
jgi:hypothetical protein